MMKSWPQLAFFGWILALGFSPAQTLPAGDPTPAELAAIADLQAWAATTAANGPAGRPLPLAGHWNAGPDFNRVLDRFSGGDITPTPQWREGWSPSYMAGLIRQGKRVVITFPDPNNATVDYYENVGDTVRLDALFDYIYKPALEYARQYHLPISFVGTNWEDHVAGSGPQTGAGTAWMLRDGVPTREVDPLGPINVWQNWGVEWMGIDLFERIRTFYPDPPLVVILNNNEGGHLIDLSQLGNNSDRFNAQFSGVTTPAQKATAIREGYAARYAALLSSARAAIGQNAWRDNIRFVAYNAWSNAVMGRGDFYPVADGTDLNFDPVAGQGYRNWAMFDGAMPEFYDNQWQGTKTDFCPWSPQIEAFNLTAIQDMVFAERPDYYFSSIAWEGGRADVAFNKVNSYITGGYGREAQRWDAARYQGMHQFGLWALRPRDYREFRAIEPRDGYNQATWEALLASTENVWSHPTLREYWRSGILVPNTTAAATLNGHYFDNNPGWPAWLKNTPRWFLLTSSANPAESTWNRDHNKAPEVKLRVLALALRLGDAPDRRWLVYAHAPLGAVAGSQVTVPGFGAVMLDYVPQSGSFFEVRENGGKITALIRGGPSEIAVSTPKRRVTVGEIFTVTAAVTHPLDEPFTSFIWTAGEGDAVIQTNLASRTFTFNTPGEHFITVEGQTASGAKLAGQIVVAVGPAPATDVVYQLGFDRAYDWQGLWGANNDAKVNYRQMPNAADTALDVPVSGGSFVTDAVRGGVFQLAQPGDGVTLLPGDRTTTLADGHPDLTISFRFKADALTGTQGLFAQGYGSSDGGGGYNIYLSGDRLYAGSWSMSGRPAASQWTGNWLATAPGRIAAGQWHHVSLVLRAATDQLADDKLFLYLDDSLIATGPAVKVKRHYTPPRLGFLGDSRIHTGVVDTRAQFRGRLDDFSYSTAAPAPADLSRLTRAINAAGPALPGPSGINYEADAGFTGGSVRTVSATAPITGGEDPDVYRTARQGVSFSYALPLSNGGHRVLLKFAELDHSAAGLRRFGVTAEGASVIANLDLFATRGLGGGYDYEFPLNISDGTLNLVFTATVGEATLAAIQVWNTSPTSATHSFFGGEATPASTGNDGSAYELGLRFRTGIAGNVTAIRYYRPLGETGSHTGRLWGPDGSVLATLPFTSESSSGWQQADLAAPVELVANQLYTVSVTANSVYAYTAQGMANARSSGPLTAPGGGVNGVYNTTPGSYPTAVYQAGLPDYHRDIVFAPSLSKLEQWRLFHFGTSADEGLAADGSDWDQDGLPNLLEYALDFIPTQASPQGPGSIGLPLEMTFKRARDEISYIVESGSTLDNWAVLATNPGTPGETVTVADIPPAGSLQRFLRLKVTTP